MRSQCFRFRKKMKESDESDRGLDLFLSSGAEFDTSATMAAVGFHASRISPPNELPERYLDVVLEGLR
ncbi:MAG: hypothetical protein U0165_10455 [Polyangiaceae bacterium]